MPKGVKNNAFMVYLLCFVLCLLEGCSGESGGSSNWIPVPGTNYQIDKPSSWKIADEPLRTMRNDPDILSFESPHSPMSIWVGSLKDIFPRGVYTSKYGRVEVHQLLKVLRTRSDGTILQKGALQTSSGNSVYIYYNSVAEIAVVFHSPKDGPLAEVVMQTVREIHSI